VEDRQTPHRKSGRKVHVRISLPVALRRAAVARPLHREPTQGREGPRRSAGATEAASDSPSSKTVRDAIGEARALPEEIVRDPERGERAATPDPRTDIAGSPLVSPSNLGEG